MATEDLETRLKRVELRLKNTRKGFIAVAEDHEDRVTALERDGKAFKAQTAAGGGREATGQHAHATGQHASIVDAADKPDANAPWYARGVLDAARDVRGASLLIVLVFGGIVAVLYVVSLIKH